MKTSFLIFVICSLLVLIAQAVQIDGYCFLGGQLNHEGTKVLFQADSPGAQTDSTYTDSAGYYQIEISLGVYDIYFSHEDYYGEEILNQFLYIPITLPDITLIHTPIGIPISGPLNGVLEGDTTYFVADNIAVNSDDSLIIEAGATLIFDEGVQFIINGYLHAAGTETDSIKFMGHSGLTWKRITFNNSMNANSILEYCLITDGYAYLGSGGGIMSNNSFLTVTNCMITGNAASYDGGGISVGGSNVLISDCIISGNQTVDGGGIAISSNPTIRNCYIINNTAQGCGGGIYSASSAASIESCIINENIADYGGGGAIFKTKSQIFDFEKKGKKAIYFFRGIFFVFFFFPPFSHFNILKNC
nr:right-handed parallel beta-helix repeat-containing protein [FCB group bacterium]